MAQPDPVQPEEEAGAEPEAPARRPFAAFLQEHRRGAVHAELGDKLAELSQARELREVRADTVHPDLANVILVRDEHGAVVPVDLDEFLERPRRKTGTHHPADVASLTQLVKDLDEEDAAIWVHPTSGKVEVVFDDHESDRPGHGEHRAVLQLQQTPAWKRWLDHNNKWLMQADFAEHIEASIPEIADPPGADLLEIASTLTGRTEVNWKAGTRLTDGTVQLQYNEEATAAAGRTEQMEIPKVFGLLIAPFLGESPVPITARLRYRVNSGDLVLGYVLDRPEEVVQDCVAAIRDRLAGEFARVYLGSPR